MSRFTLRRKDPQPAQEGSTPMTGFGHRTPEQRAEALEKARVVRRERAEFLALMKAGELTLADAMVRHEDPIVGRIKVSQLLRALPGIGAVRAADKMAEIGIDENRRVGGLGQHQRAMLSEWHR